MLAEIAVGGTRKGTVVGQIAVVVPQFDLVCFGAFDLGGDFVVGRQKAANRADGKVFFATPESSGSGEVFEHSEGDQTSFQTEPLNSSSD
ncbi:MAG: hypothetical protein Q8L93_02145 [Rhodocyclaceae bacterium]|nr:hypothetical protein [Rhodocyclaceae bacterium]